MNGELQVMTTPEEIRKSDKEFIMEMESAEMWFRSFERAKAFCRKQFREYSAMYVLYERTDDMNHRYWDAVQVSIHTMDDTEIRVGDVVYDYDNVQYEIEHLFASEIPYGDEEEEKEICNNENTWDFEHWCAVLRNTETNENVWWEFTFYESGKSLIEMGLKSVFWTDDDRKRYDDIEKKRQEKRDSEFRLRSFLRIALFLILTASVIAGIVTVSRVMTTLPDFSPLPHFP